ncbi:MULTISPECIES: peptidoglycan DD-metalloendopeptidase family protein [Pasteurellaceae]|uniref:Peptidoglycan DD-metalloendopeptidase family protein n=1 Tax=Pasteurella atlantica TaxID=2827233 RepID=A0AAW8CNA2_9PAST|nr:peptidoglycan DD-metalloendopeptidase family protein [Pasteurella atlantica]MBR0573302.1 peptidoglycan DD-metalloendopeptidase family protein [Pasteurella atlantica]MDP8040146.1 peptidoglycan DD-metalloendopeptidase family protein [Pasteurella atlantica]MDP8042259.1 peptidoglycan DD-metalloendopeptidase family protein [Pasteurella atlantica]MDP8044434.1 peptidoglycan DD-metalloendopeptidase family protein [Pasteurella atlantica]MDP8046446.1 peptidoglycan DD-metalloendopeptidase family prote
MKKLVLFFPLTMIALTACGSNRAAPVEYASGSGRNIQLPPPVNVVNHNVRLQRAKMPSSMNTASKPIQKEILKPSAISTKKVVRKITRKIKVKEKEIERKIKIPRDSTTHKPIYSQIDKGSYDGNVYTVRKGDTLFLVAYIAGKDVKEVAKLNGLKEPYSLSIGQKIKLSSGYTEKVVTKKVVVEKPVKQEPNVTYTQAANGTAYGSDGTVKGPIKATTNTATPTATQISVSNSHSLPVADTESIKWHWPTAGRVISSFSSVDGGNKGIDLTGSKGQAVKAAAKGRVVYAGNALQGYGNLIIIKHSDNYLSAYAHNDEILVDENDTVKLGQRIATMGNTGTNTTKLHFEIRYKGKSVNPMDYLPRR